MSDSIFDSYAKNFVNLAEKDSLYIHDTKNKCRHIVNVVTKRLVELPTGSYFKIDEELADMLDRLKIDQSKIRELAYVANASFTQELLHSTTSSLGESK